jgi:cysteinyl-tRNA synthetase
VTVLRAGELRRFAPGERFALTELGPFRWPQPAAGLPQEVWSEAVAAHETAALPPQAPSEVLALAAERQAARERRDWATADSLRNRIQGLGWQVQDTPNGPHWFPVA